MRRLAALLLAPLAAVLLTAAEPAPPPDTVLPDAAQEARARALFEEIRCVVCQHESIADSPAGVASDMRRLVREEIAGGSSDAAIREDLVRRYGDYVLFRPPFDPATWLLWLGPALLVVLAGLWFALRARRPTPVSAPLTPEEEARLADILQTEGIRRDPDATSPHDGRAAGTTIPPA